MLPVEVAALRALAWRRRLQGVAGEPAPYVVAVELFAPEQARIGLALHQPRVVVVHAGLQRGIELVGLGEAPGHHRLEPDERINRRARAQPQPQRRRLARAEHHGAQHRRLGAASGGIDRGPIAGHDEIVEPVLGEARARLSPQLVEVAVVLGEQRLAFVIPDQLALDVAVEIDADALVLQPQFRPGIERRPRPAVAEENLRQQRQPRRVGPAIGRRHAHQDVFDVVFGVFDLDVEIFVALERAGVDQLELALIQTAPRVFLAQLFIGEARLRIFVEHAHVGVARRAVEVEVKLLDVLAVVALQVRETVQPLFQDRVGAVPQRQRQAEPLPIVAETGDAVLSPAIGASAGLFERKIFPGGAVGGIVLAHRAPLAVAEIRPPAAPVPACGDFRQPPRLGGVLQLARGRVGGFRLHGDGVAV